MLIGDHLFVDRLAYSPSGSISKHLLPYQDVKRGDIIVFRYPVDIRQMYVKRVIGVPGDRIRIENKVVHLNGKPLTEPYKVLIPRQSSTYLNNFPQTPDIPIKQRGLDMLRATCANGELVVPEGHYFAMGDNRDNSEDSRFWGLVPRENIIGQARHDLVVLRCANGAPVRRQYSFRSSRRHGSAFRHQDAMGSHVPCYSAAILSSKRRSVRRLSRDKLLYVPKENYYGLILAGGRGTRFWPRSRRRDRSRC